MIQVGNTINVNLEVGDRTYPVYFKTDHTNLHLSPESIVAATLLPSMKFGQHLNSGLQLDEQFFSSLDRIQEIMSTWHNSLSRIPVETASSPKVMEPSNGVGAFFTGGVDSFYTLLKHKEEITHLIYVHGYENHQVTEEIRQIAKEFDKEVIEIETNLRDFSDPIVNWHAYHGSALASVAHLLKPVIGKIFIPSSNTYGNLIPWGSHPLVDPLWSSSNLTVLHDGCEATRVDKVAHIAQNEIALKSLRVCWKDNGAKKNCGHCEKCLRTMICLDVVHALEQCATFPDTLSLRKIARINADSRSTRADFQDVYSSIQRLAGDTKLLWVVWWILNKPSLVLKINRIIRSLINRIRNRLE